MNLFDVAQRGMSAQLVRMNAASSNLANAGSVSSTEEGAYRPIRAVFAEQLDAADAYEVGDYKRVEVALRSGRAAWAYVKA